MRFVPICESLAVALTHPLSGPILRSIHRRRKVTRIKLNWCDYCHKLFARERSTLFRHIERNHKDHLKKEDSVVCSKKETNNSNIQYCNSVFVAGVLHSIFNVINK